MYKLTPDKDIKVIKTKAGRVPLLVISAKDKKAIGPGVLWIHGGGYILGMKEMVYMSRGVDLVREFGATVISPGYRLAFQSPYPAAIDDCYEALLYLNSHADELGIDKEKIVIGGESAGGGLAAALSIMASDHGEVKVKAQFPLYPMIDNFDTESSKDNHGRIWNTKRNHFGWKMYLRGSAKEEVSPYAAASRLEDFSNLPPCYTFAGNGEPFYFETLKYVENLKKAGIKASCDIYGTDIHAFDMMYPDLEISKTARANFLKAFNELVNE